jgi:hypothetical protein
MQAAAGNRNNRLSGKPQFHRKDAAVDFEVLKKMNLFVFDIETVPDVESGRRLYGLDRLDERNAAAMFRLRAQETGGSEFLHHHLHRIVAISGVSPDSLASTNEQTPPRIASA